MAAVDLQEATRNIRRTQLQFILTELAAGLTFASVATNAGKGKEQSRTRARAAYDSVLRFLDRVPLTEEESQKVQGKLEELKDRLEELGEKF